MHKRRLWNKVLSLVLSVSMIGTPIAVVKSNTYAGESKNYIIMAKDGQSLDQFMTRYGSRVIEDKTTDVLEESNIAVVEMTEAEAVRCISFFDTDSIIIEEDVTVTAMAEDIEEVEEETLEPQKVIWNIKAVNGEKQNLGIERSTSSNIKIGIIDSGIEALGEIEPTERINLQPVEGEEVVVNPIFEDVTGHGTSVAGIISAADDEYGIVGINPDAQLYDIKVFDEYNTAPLSRIIEGIQYALDKDVDILNMSFGTPISSEILHQKIAEAYNEGMLLVAASGNNGVIEYPATYNEVMAVGATTEKNEVADFSLAGTQSEIVAPGAAVLTSGLLGGYGVVDGTSISAPHVSAAASLLWAKDPTKSNDFIRQLLNQSARKLEDVNSGNGLLDIKRAFEIYDGFSSVYVPGKVEYKEIPENEDPLETFDENYVVGSWSTDEHKALVTGLTTTEATQIVKLGAVAPDQPAYGLQGMKQYPQLHGFTSWTDSTGITKYCNYMASYIYLTQMALGFPKDRTNSNTYTQPDRPDFMSIDDFEKIKDIASATKFGGVSWSTVLKDYGVTDRNKRLFMYGVALHTATDLFAHSTYTLDGDYIDHDNGADNTKVHGNRHTCAQEMAKQVVKRILGYTKGSLADFKNAVSVYSREEIDEAFKIKSYSTKAEKVDPLYYENNKAAFDKVSE